MKIYLPGNTMVATTIVVLLTLGIAACDNSSDETRSESRSDSMTAAISDAAMTAQVKAKLATAGDLKSSDISVSTANGVVTLEGTVANADAKARAEQVANSVDGVRSIRNNLHAGSGGISMAGAERVMSDSWITTKVKSELLADSLSKGFEVNVETRQGVVALSGEMKDQAAVDHVTEIAEGVEGVKNVDTSGLTVSD